MSSRPPFYRPAGVELVYVLRKGRAVGGPIKIGFSTKIARRYRELQDMTPEMLKFLCVIVPGSMKLERALHFAFRDWALGHEWFQAPPEQAAQWEEFWEKVHRDSQLQSQVVKEALDGALHATIR